MHTLFKNGHDLKELNMRHSSTSNVCNVRKTVKLTYREHRYIEISVL